MKNQNQWIEHVKSGIPVNPSDEVEVEFYNGVTDRREAFFFPWHLGEYPYRHRWDIKRYRLIKPIKERTK